MRAELDARLGDKFKFMRGVCCECDDGWFDLIWDMCTEIVGIFQVAEVVPDIKILQLKEKFGDLRVYWSTSCENEVKDKIDGAISRSEERSSKICEECGKVGEHVTSGTWIKTLCVECVEEMCN